MTNPAAPAPPAPGRALHRAAVAAAAVVFGLIVAGALVTSSDAGLAVPDWPLAYGKLFPERWFAIRNIRTEHLHRLYAFLTGCLALLLPLMAWRARAPRFARRFALALPALVLIQGLLGAQRIIHFNALWTAMLHGVFGQLTFCAFVAFASVTAAGWPRRAPCAGPIRLQAAVGALLLGQLVLAAVMRHERWGLAIPDFPLLRGALPDFAAPGAAVAFAHRLHGLILLVVLALQPLFTAGAAPAVRRLAFAQCALAPLQVVLGVATVLTGRSPALATLHTAGGALLLALQVALLVWIIPPRAAEAS